MHFEPYAKWKKAVAKDYILYDSISMKCPEEKQAERLVLQDSNTYKAIVVQTVEYWHKEGQKNKEQRVQK